jgi:hypothetical protein
MTEKIVDQKLETILRSFSWDSEGQLVKDDEWNDTCIRMLGSYAWPIINEMIYQLEWPAGQRHTLAYALSVVENNPDRAADVGYELRDELQSVIDEFILSHEGYTNLEQAVELALQWLLAKSQQNKKKQFT